MVITDILPSAGAPVLVRASVLMAVGILIEAVLSFLGVGVRPDAVARAHAPDGRGFNDAGAVDR